MAKGGGYLGNSATNVIFPLTTIGLSLGLLFGSGCAVMFSLLLESGKKERAARCVGNAIVLLLITGILYVVITRPFCPKSSSCSVQQKVYMNTLWTMDGLFATDLPFI